VAHGHCPAAVCFPIGILTGFWFLVYGLRVDF
jgi:hypothetical protein